MPDQQRYFCGQCTLTKMIPESPSTAPRSVRTGCDRCRAITRHYIDGGGPLPEHLRGPGYDPFSGHRGVPSPPGDSPETDHGVSE